MISAGSWCHTEREDDFRLIFTSHIMFHDIKPAKKKVIQRSKIKTETLILSIHINILHICRIYSVWCCMAASLVFRLQDRGPELLREVLLERGWEEYDEEEREEEDWNLYWRSTAFRSSEYHNLLPWQRLNHHPKTVGITRKVTVWHVVSALFVFNTCRIVYAFQWKLDTVTRII